MTLEASITIIINFNIGHMCFTMVISPVNAVMIYDIASKYLYSRIKHRVFLIASHSYLTAF